MQRNMDMRLLHGTLDDIRMELGKVGWGDVDWIALT
jgi:hypothetical protein